MLDVALGGLTPMRRCSASCAPTPKNRKNGLQPSLRPRARTRCSAIEKADPLTSLPGNRQRLFSVDRRPRLVSPKLPLASGFLLISTASLLLHPSLAIAA